jgi:NADH-quinone oxidoreductase subunit J
MSIDAVLFWFLALISLGSALGVLFFANPIFASLSLAMTMVSIAALFVTLNAYFIAGVQLIVYAGAVMVLFVMVLMLFDLKKEKKSFSKGTFTNLIKVCSVGVFAGILLASFVFFEKNNSKSILSGSYGDKTKELAQLLYTKYVLLFEVLGILLLVIAIGVVALAKSKGGTHASNS